MTAGGLATGRSGPAQLTAYRTLMTLTGALTCRIELVILAVTPIAVTAERVIGGNLDQDDLDAIGSWAHISVKPQGSVRAPG